MSSYALGWALSTYPPSLLWTLVTLGAYAVARRLQQLAGGTPLLNPVLLAIGAVACALIASRTSYAAYFTGSQTIHFLLGPATVALAIPLARNLKHVRRVLPAVSAAVLVGASVSMLSGVALVRILGGSRAVAMSMAPKAATTPIAIALSQQLGGVPALTAVFAIAGGVTAAVAGQQLLSQMGIVDPKAHGMASGVAGSGVAAAQAATLGGTAAAFAALGIALNGVVTSLLTPLVQLWWP